MKKYPQILKEENRAPEQRRLSALLREHLIDIDFVNDENDNPSSVEGVDNEVDVNGAHITFGDSTSLVQHRVVTSYFFIIYWVHSPC